MLPPGAEGATYDRRAAVYDALVGSPVYNRLLWATRPDHYRDFARRAVRSDGGPLLEVGCGSATFTAGAYLESKRPCLLVDRSVGMLERAAGRLTGSDGELPAHVGLLQADLDALPLRAEHFTTVLFMGGLHLLPDVAGTLGRLGAHRAPRGRLFLSALVAETTIGRRYLRLLHAAGEVARPRTEAELREEITEGVDVPVTAWERRGSMVYAEAGGGESGARAPRASAR